MQEIVGGQQPRRSRRHRNIRSEEQDGAAASMTRVNQQREGPIRSIRRINATRSVEQGDLAGAGHAPKRGRPVESEQSEVTENGGISRSDSIIFQKLQHICIKEAKNPPYPQNTREQFVMYRER